MISIAEKIKNYKKIKAYKQLFRGDEGRTVLMDLMRSFGISRTSFDKDPQITAFKEGQRSVVLNILNLLNIDEQKILEYVNKQKQKEREKGGKYGRQNSKNLSRPQF